VQPLLDPYADDPESSACKALIENLQNPYYIGDQAAGTQTSGWLDAWMPAPSAYAVAATTRDHVAASVNFARENRLRLVLAATRSTSIRTDEAGRLSAHVAGNAHTLL